MKITQLALLLPLTVALLSCSGDTGPNSLSRIGHYYAADDTVPSCTAELEAALIYVEGTGFQVCRSTVWEDVDLGSSDTTAPAVSNGTLTVSGLLVNSATLTWQAATPDTGEASFDLEYLLVRSNSAISTLALANAATAISGWQMTRTFTDSTLSGTTTYHYNVIVRDNHGNKAIYTSQSVTTPSNLVLFSSAANFDGNLGGRTGADDICEDAATAASLSYANIHALISISATDEIQDMPSLYSLPTNRAIVSATGTQVADDWADLLDGSLDASLQTSGVLTGSTYWWSASTTAGALNSSGGGTTCSGFTTGAVVAGPWIGSRSATDSNWVASSIGQCDQTYRVVCVAW